MTLRMVTTSLDVNNGQSAAKRLSNGERSETVRDGMGSEWQHKRACLTFSPTPAKAEPLVEEGSRGNALLESPEGVRIIVAPGVA